MLHPDESYVMEFFIKRETTLKLIYEFLTILGVKKLGICDMLTTQLSYSFYGLFMSLNFTKLDHVIR